MIGDPPVESLLSQCFAPVVNAIQLFSYNGMESPVRTKLFNPAGNQIPSSVKEESLIQAVESSGYPLQGMIASKLRDSAFSVTEEWGFSDRDTNGPRTLDLAAYRPLKLENVAPGLLLLIECKKSIHPYVFFRTLGHQDVSWFPRIAGLIHGGITMLHELDGMVAVQRLVPGSQAFGLCKLPFVEAGPDICAVFSRAEANGKKVELSGSEPSNSVIMPLANACDHAMRVFGHPARSDVVYPDLIICVAVLDAPMLLVESPEQGSDPILTPWVRIIRQEPNLDQFVEERIKHYAVDVVHVDFFDTFIKTHILPFAREFGSRAIQLGVGPMLNGGRVPDIERWEWTEITEYKR